MKQYQDYLRAILEQGTWQSNRTGVDAISIPGYMLKFDLQEGFPAVTTKRLFFNAVKGELLGFLRGCSSAADFRELGCKIWDANANNAGSTTSLNRWLTNPNRKGQDDLGRIYGVQWRNWRGKLLQKSHGTVEFEPAEFKTYSTGKEGEKHDEELCFPEYDASLKYESIDQLQRAIDTIKTDPTNRRIIINAWRPDEFDQMALPPCHVLYQFLVNVERNELSLCMYQRSVDSFLGAPFNIASASLLLSIVAKLTCYKPRHFTHFLADCHIYRNHLDQVNELLSRTPHKLPTLVLSDRFKTVEEITPFDIQLFNYEYHPELKAPMAV